MGPSTSWLGGRFLVSERVSFASRQDQPGFLCVGKKKNKTKKPFKPHFFCPIRHSDLLINLTMPCYFKGYFGGFPALFLKFFPLWTLAIKEKKGARPGGRQVRPGSSCPGIARRPGKTPPGRRTTFSFPAHRERIWLCSCASLLEAGTRWRAGALPSSGAAGGSGEGRSDRGKAGLGSSGVRRLRIWVLAPLQTIFWSAICSPEAHRSPSPSVGSAGSAPVGRPGALSAARHWTPPARRN